MNYTLYLISDLLLEVYNQLIESANQSPNPMRRIRLRTNKSSIASLLRASLGRLIFLLLLANFSNFTQAHTLVISNAEVELITDNQLTIKLEVDLMRLLQSTQSDLKTDQQLLDFLKSQSRVELFELFKKIENELKNSTLLYFDDQRFYLEHLDSPNISALSNQLTQQSRYTNYQVTFVGLGSYPSHAKHLSIQFPASLGVVNLKLSRPNHQLIAQAEKSASYLLKNGQPSLSSVLFSNVLSYVYQGFIHIIPLGFDHILFVLALFLLGRKLSTLLWQISAFTLAHTVTLGLGIYGIVSIPSGIVEPLIALSIVYVAFENSLNRPLNSSRIAVVFGFGLLHGLGFASALLALGLPKNLWLSSLVSFNVGVELGQLGVILIAFLLLGRAQKRDDYHSRLVRPISLFILLIASYWFIQRLFF